MSIAKGKCIYERLDDSTKKKLSSANIFVKWEKTSQMFVFKGFSYSLMEYDIDKVKVAENVLKRMMQVDVRNKVYVGTSENDYQVEHDNTYMKEEEIDQVEYFGKSNWRNDVNSDSEDIRGKINQKANLPLDIDYDSYQDISILQYLFKINSKLLLETKRAWHRKRLNKQDTIWVSVPKRMLVKNWSRKKLYAKVLKPEEIERMNFNIDNYKSITQNYKKRGALDLFLEFEKEIANFKGYRYSKAKALEKWKHISYH